MGERDKGSEKMNKKILGICMVGMCLLSFGASGTSLTLSDMDTNSKTSDLRVANAYINIDRSQNVIDGSGASIPFGGFLEGDCSAKLDVYFFGVDTPYRISGSWYVTIGLYYTTYTGESYVFFNNYGKSFDYGMGVNSPEDIHDTRTKHVSSGYYEVYVKIDISVNIQKNGENFDHIEYHNKWSKSIDKSESPKIKKDIDSYTINWDLLNEKVINTPILLNLEKHPCLFPMLQRLLRLKNNPFLSKGF